MAKRIQQRGSALGLASTLGNRSDLALGLGHEDNDPVSLT